MTEGAPRRLLFLFLALASSGASAGINVNISGSAYVDYMNTTSSDARASALTGLTPEFALKLDLDATDELSVSVRTCLGCHGIMLDRFHA